MKIRKYIIISLMSLLMLIILSGTFVSLKVKSRVKELFQMNKQLQEEGYYMAEFEFQMLGVGYYLGKGKYRKAVRKLSDYHSFLNNKDNLVKLPDFKNNREEFEFYLNLQNPQTGAFMDPSAPFCTFFSNTENILMHLEALHDPSEGPVKLKYPLTFLKEVDTPEEVISYLNEIAYVNRLGAKLPQTTFHFARDMFSNASEDNVIERNNLFHFSDEWKQTILQWMYEFQDEQTGLWGPKHRKSNQLLKSDINNTYSILKNFRDSNGDDIHSAFPLKHHQQLFESTLEQLNEPIPDEDDLSWVHEWNLQQVKGIKMLLSRLWKGTTEEHRKEAKKVIERFIKVSFEKYYVEKDGAFSYYPNAEHATVDGMSNMILKTTGALSYEEFRKLWGEPEDRINDLGTIMVDSIDGSNLGRLVSQANINSIRIYNQPPRFTALSEDVWAVFYPDESRVLDITELIPNIKKWMETSGLSTGNWKSMADIKNEYDSIIIEKPLILRKETAYKTLNDRLNAQSEIYMVGFDVLQIPQFQVHIKLE